MFLWILLISIYRIIPSMNKGSPLRSERYLFVSYIIVPTRTSSVMLDRRGESRHPYLAPHLRMILLHFYY